MFADRDSLMARSSRGVSSTGGYMDNGESSPIASGDGGTRDLSSMLSLDGDILRRCIDYENMDDYPELCLAGESHIFTVEHGWAPIEKLADMGAGFSVMAYDRRLRTLVPAKISSIAKTGDEGHSKPMVRVTLGEDRVIRCTADHRFMQANGEWIAAVDMLSGQRLMPRSGKNVVIKVEKIADRCPIYDIRVPGHGNFVCNGVVVHNSAALDYYADDTTVPDSIHGKTIWAVSRDRLFRDLIDDCLHRRIRIEEDIWSAVRTFCKYGNLYGENVLVENMGLVGINWLPVATVRRVVDGKTGGLLGYMQDINGRFRVSSDDFEKLLKHRDREELNTDAMRGIKFFYPWEITHWRLRSKHMRSMYGYSILEPARWVWKRLQMLEDTALVYKLTRSPARYAFYIDTGDLPPKAAMALVEKVRRRFKKRKLIDPVTGQLDTRYNPLAADEDFFIPVRRGSESTKIDVIAGPDSQSMEDIEYFRAKMMFSVKLPRSYWGSDSGSNKGPAAQEDVRFARTAMRIQREFRNGIKYSIRVHLAALGIDPDSTKWDVRMSVPSAIFELQQIEVMSAQAGLAGSLEPYFTKEWLLQHVFHATEDDAAYITQEKAAEADRAARQSAATDQDIATLYPDADRKDDKEESIDMAVDERIARLIESSYGSSKFGNLMLDIDK